MFHSFEYNAKRMTYLRQVLLKTVSKGIVNEKSVVSFELFFQKNLTLIIKA